MEALTEWRGRKEGRRVARAKVARRVARKTSLVRARLEGGRQEATMKTGPALSEIGCTPISLPDPCVVTGPFYCLPSFSFYLLCGFCTALSKIFIANSLPASSLWTFFFSPSKAPGSPDIEPRFFLRGVSVVTKRIIARPRKGTNGARATATTTATTHTFCRVRCPCLRTGERVSSVHATTHN